MFEKISLVIGKDIRENHVDVNLNQSPYAAMIDIEHAVLNYAGGSWYIEDLGSKKRSGSTKKRLIIENIGYHHINHVG